uniref:WD repeat-containing protein 25 n=1 Tax=Kalanchoe fedtschenkoi TaxID=63787 RepID=A0A7N0UY72_KALFE
MDLLTSAYTNDSDDDGDASSQPPSKRPRFPHGNNHQTPTPTFRPQSFPAYRRNPMPMPNFRPEPPVPGRYVSKRDRALMESSNQLQEPSRPAPVAPPSVSVTGSISNSNLLPEVSLALKQRKNDRTSSGLPERLSLSFTGHSKAVNAIQWSPSHSHLLASAGMDNMVYIWNVWSQDQKKARVVNCHTSAVKDVKWSTQGLSVLSCGYDCTSRLSDVEKGIETQVFKEDQVVGVVKFHPKNFNLFISGGSKGNLKLYDIRAGKAVHEYHRRLGPILDVEFINDAKQFISSSDVSGSNISENSIIVWDVLRQVPLSNQVYVEAFTCPCIKSHPSDPHFVAQSNGNYIAIFSSLHPYRLDKYKRYEGHGVGGFPVKCNFSFNGDIIASGSYDGNIYLYNYHSSLLMKKIKVYEQPCIDVAFHPIMPNVVATCSWSGDVSILH